MPSLFSGADVRRMDTLRQGRTGDAVTKTIRDKASLQLKQRHQRDISPRRILHDSVGMRDDSPSTLHMAHSINRKASKVPFAASSLDATQRPTIIDVVVPTTDGLSLVPMQSPSSLVAFARRLPPLAGTFGTLLPDRLLAIPCLHRRANGAEKRCSTSVSVNLRAKGPKRMCEASRVHRGQTPRRGSPWMGADEPITHDKDVKVRQEAARAQRPMAHYDQLPVAW